MRRSIFPVFALVLSACAQPTPAPVTASAATSPAPAPSLETFTSDASGFDTHSFWLDTGREVVVFDAQFTPDLANTVIADIRAKTKNPIRFLVVTHPNPDKFNGAPAFQAAGAKVVASESTAKAIPGVHAYKKYFFVNMAKMFTDATYPAEAKIDLTFKGDFDLPLDGPVKVKLHELAHRGVLSTQTVAFVPSRRALVVGDLVHHRAHAWLEGGIVDGKAQPDLASWKLALDELRAFRSATVYGGRGPSASVAEAVVEEDAYLDRIDALVTGYVADLGPAKAELDGPKAGEHHKKIAALAAKAFPDYAYPYLVEYGVYGLLQQKK
jgi:glyoxylase-like metal-dependent hydrolase (beta-lactamase superfamily II)